MTRLFALVSLLTTAFASSAAASSCSEPGQTLCGSLCISAGYKCCPGQLGACPPDAYCTMSGHGKPACCSVGKLCSSDADLSEIDILVGSGRVERRQPDNNNADSNSNGGDENKDTATTTTTSRSSARATTTTNTKAEKTDDAKTKTGDDNKKTGTETSSSTSTRSLPTTSHKKFTPTTDVPVIGGDAARGAVPVLGAAAVGVVAAALAI